MKNEQKTTPKTNSPIQTLREIALLPSDRVLFPRYGKKTNKSNYICRDFFLAYTFLTNIKWNPWSESHGRGRPRSLKFGETPLFAKRIRFPAF